MTTAILKHTRISCWQTSNNVEDPNVPSNVRPEKTESQENKEFPVFPANQEPPDKMDFREKEDRQEKTETTDDLESPVNPDCWDFRVSPERGENEA